MKSSKNDSKLGSASGSPIGTAPVGSRDLACTLDPDLCITYANDALCKCFDIPREMLLGTSFLCLVPVEIRDDERNALSYLTREDPLAIREILANTARGTRCLQWMCAARFDSQGKLQSFCLAGRDMTGRSLPRDMPCNACKQILDIIEFLPDPAFIIDRDKNVIAWNRAMEELTGVPRSEIMGKGKPAYSLSILGKQRPMLIDLLDEYDYKASTVHPNIERRGDALYTESRIPSKDTGEEICVWAKARSLRDIQGRKIGAIELLKDITEIKRARKALLDARFELEARVSERTRELKNSNEALIEEIQERKHAERMLISSLQEKEVLLREVYHRVKNNLQIISSLLSIQSEYIKDEKAIEAFKESRNRIRSMSLIHEKIYRSEDLTKIDFVDYARNLISALMAAYNIHKNTIDVRLNAQGVFLGIDKAIPCGLIINELISNSLKHAFNQRSKGVIRVDLRPQGDSRLVLIIGDDGCGLPADMDIGKSKSFGLKLVSTLVEQLKGTIDLSREGGTQYKIIFDV